LPLVVKLMRLRSPSYSQISRERTFTSYWQRERPTLRPSQVQEAEVEVEPHQQVIIDFISFTSIVLAFEGDVMVQSFTEEWQLWQQISGSDLYK
jgi:hypothetical protein